MRCAARAMAGAAFCGSAQPSVGTCKAQRNSPLRPGHQPLEILAAHDAGADVEGTRHREPGIEARFIGFGLADIHDAAFAKSGRAAREPVHIAPQPQALDDQRHLPLVAPGLAAPTPIAARLLARDVRLLAEHDRDPAGGERQRGRRADDAAADDGDARGREGSLHPM